VECPSIIEKGVCVQASVNVTPNVEIGEPQSCCVGSPKLTPCRSGKYDYEVKQLVCVQIPMKLSVDAKVEAPKIVCEPPPCLPLPHSKKPRSCGLPERYFVLFFIMAMICGFFSPRHSG
jgi:hypothetical protein